MRKILLSLVPVATLVVSLHLIDLPWFVEVPGKARSVLPLIDVDGVPTYDSDGRLLLTTVNVGRVNVYGATWAWLDEHADLVHEDLLIPPGQTQAEYERTATSQMDQSKIAGVAVALEMLTEYPEDHGPGVLVQDAIAGGPSVGRLFAGDLIVGFDGEPLEDAADLGARLEEARPGLPVKLTVRPVEGGEEHSVKIVPVLDPEQDRPVLGILAIANFPFDVRIESADIGGPSAGLMWSVGVTDLLTQDDLTADRTIAGTGTVDLAGNVGPIGGIRLKIIAAERAGAELFLVPRDNFAEAKGAGSEIDLVPVGTVREALDALEGTTS